MAGNRITGLSAAVDPNDAIIKSQIVWEPVGAARNIAGLSAVDWTNLSVYRELRLTVNVTPSAVSSIVLFVSVDNGATFLSGATDYVYGAFGNENGVIAGGGLANNNNFPLASATAGAGGLARFNVNISDFNKVASQPITSDGFFFRNSSGVYRREFGTGYIVGSGGGNVKNALRLAISGIASSGFAILEGVRG